MHFSDIKNAIDMWEKYTNNLRIHIKGHKFKFYFSKMNFTKLQHREVYFCNLTTMYHVDTGMQ